MYPSSVDVQMPGPALRDERLAREICEGEPDDLRHAETSIALLCLTANGNNPQASRSSVNFSFSSCVRAQIGEVVAKRYPEQCHPLLLTSS